MEWTDLIKAALGGSPLAIVLGFAVWTLWQTNQKKDAQIQELNLEFRKVLRDISQRADDD